MSDNQMSDAEKAATKAAAEHPVLGPYFIGLEREILELHELLLNAVERLSGLEAIEENRLLTRDNPDRRKRMA